MQGMCIQLTTAVFHLMSSSGLSVPAFLGVLPVLVFLPPTACISLPVVHTDIYACGVEACSLTLFLLYSLPHRMRYNLFVSHLLRVFGPVLRFMA